MKVEVDGYQPYERHIELIPGEQRLEDIRLVPTPPTSSNSEPSHIDQSSPRTTSIKSGTGQCGGLPFELTEGKLIRLKLNNGRLLIGVIQTNQFFNNNLSKGIIPLVSHSNLKKLQSQFGTNDDFPVLADKVNNFIDWINISDIHSCELVEMNLRNFHLVTKSGKKIEPTDKFRLQLSAGKTPGTLMIKYQLSGAEKLFDAGELEIKDGIISLPVTTVFISYARENQTQVISISKNLQNHGILTWFDENMILSGDNWQLKAEQAIEQADYFLPFLSCQYNYEELHYAMYQQSLLPKEKRFIIPILLDDCDAPYNLKKFSPVKITDESWFEKLLKSMAPIPRTSS